MSDTNRVSLTYRAEGAYATLPSTPTFKALRYVSETFKQDTQSVQSNEIRSDRHISDIIRTGVTTPGDIDCELSFGAHDDLIAAAFGNSVFDKLVSVSATSSASADNSINSSAAFVNTGLTANTTPVCTASAGATSVTLTAATLTGIIRRGDKITFANQSTVYTVQADVTAAANSATASIYPPLQTAVSGTVWAAVQPNPFAAGNWVLLSGFSANPSQNRPYRIATFTSTSKLILEGGTLANETVGITVVRGARVVTSIDTPTFTIEKQFTDLSNEFEYIPGCGVESWELNYSADGIITHKFSLKGQKIVSNTATLSTGGTPTAAPTNPVMNGVDNVSLVLENMASFNTISGTFRIGNNLRDRMQAGTLGSISLGAGSFDIGGSISYYYTSKTLVDKNLNWTSTGLAFAFRETPTSANCYIIDIPTARVTSAGRNAPGLNQDVIVEAEFSAYLNSTLSIMAQCVKFA
jgi:hypothetical protein